MYKLRYGFDGKVSGVAIGNKYIPASTDNVDFQNFLEWNKAQKEPLDLNSTIEPVKPQPVRDFAKEIDELKAKISALEETTVTISDKIEQLEVKAKVEKI